MQGTCCLNTSVNHLAGVVFGQGACAPAALVCDVEANKAVERLYQAKGMEPSKPLSILCKNFSDIQTYTLGFPSTSTGQDTFRIARRALPGPVSLGS